MNNQNIAIFNARFSIIRHAHLAVFQRQARRNVFVHFFVHKHPNPVMIIMLLLHNIHRMYNRIRTLQVSRALNKTRVRFCPVPTYTAD